MSDEPADLTAFTQSLAEARPHPGQLNRDALLFAAGRAAGRRGHTWPTVAGALALVSIGLSATLLLRPPSVVEVERVVFVTTPSAPGPHDIPESAPSAQQRPPLVAAPLAPDWGEGLRQRERAFAGDDSNVRATVWATLPPHSKTDDVPDLAALRLNATPAPGDRLP